jgi:hypothetical protein
MTSNLPGLFLISAGLRTILAAAVISNWVIWTTAAQAETEPVITAKQALGGAASGPNYQVQDQVTTDGLLRIYTIETRYGTLVVHGNAMLLQRRRELSALAALEKQSRSEAFGNAMTRAATAPVELAGDLLTNPGGAVKRTVSGIGEVFGRVTSGIKNIGSDPDNAAKSALGVSAARRKIAFDLGVDPYTDFAPLAQQLDEFAKASAIGGLVVKAGISFVPGAAGTALSASSTVQGLGSLVRDKTPAQLLDINRSRLGKVGVPRDATNKFLANRQYTPADQTVIVTALQQLRGVKNLATYVDRLAQANRRDLAIFLRARTEMIAAYQQRTGAIVRFVSIRGIPLSQQSDGSLMFLAPLDSLIWNDMVSKAFAAVTSDVRKGGTKGRLVVSISGSVSTESSRQLKQLGWSVTPAQ